MNTETTKTNKASYNTLRELINSSMEGLKIILTHDNDGQPKVQVEYLGNNSKEKAERVSSAFKELRGRLVLTEPPTKLPPVIVTTQQQVISDEEEGIFIRFPDDLSKELLYLSKNAMWKPRKKTELSVSNIARRLLISYIDEVKDTPIGDFTPYISSGIDNKACVRLPGNMIKFIKNIAKEKKVSENSVVVAYLRRALKQTDDKISTITTVPCTKHSLPQKAWRKPPELKNVIRIRGTRRFFKKLNKAASELSHRTTRYINDAISELIENSDSILAPRQFSRIVIKGREESKGVYVPKQTRDEIKRLSKTYKIPMESIIHEAVVARLGKTDATVRDGLGVIRVPRHKYKSLKISTTVPPSVVDTLHRELPDGMRFSEFARSVIIEELSNIKGEAIVVVRKSPDKQTGFKMLTVSLPKWCEELLDGAVMSDGVENYSALIRELLTRWTKKHTQQ